MRKKSTKPTPEAKALSLFLMAYKTKDPLYKEQSKRINRMWDQVGFNNMSKSEYLREVQAMIISYGGYEEIIRKTVAHYIEKTGEWKLQGDDKYCKDASKIAEELLQK